MPFAALAVANEIIALRSALALRTTNVEANKLTYIGHGFYMALYNSWLIAEQVEAWTYGPVVPSIYHQAKASGLSPIGSLGNGERIPRGKPEGRRAIKLLQAVVKRYRNHDAYALIALTHREGSPWDTVTKGGEDLGRHRPIPNELIAAFYKRMLGRG